MSLLTQRAEVLLKTLIESYIEEGKPLGSRTLARRAGLDLSPATIRSVMADLEDMGLVVSPHTSAGRIPTQAGYRLFVDSLLKVRPPEFVDVERLENALSTGRGPQSLIESASDLLSQVTHMTGLVRVPRRDEETVFQQIEFISLSSNRVLVILVTKDGQVLNRVIQPDRQYSASELVEAGNYFNDTWSGKSLNAVKRMLLQEIEQDSAAMQRVVRMATEMTRRAFAEDDSGGDDFVVRGESNLFDIPEMGDMAKLRQLFDAFSAKRDLLHLLDRSMHGGGINIFIGAESGYAALENCSLVTAPYTVGDKIVGTLGVIGPTRMPYNRVIPIVDVTARLVSHALSRGES
ncbi:MAG: HrcA family transcriptional regulator [Acidithiobacillales bacterium SG8_45]|nr:MAG: HrcA family transcriptional regulator [Acidithiobacillales bacterium SG8_45]